VGLRIHPVVLDLRVGNDAVLRGIGKHHLGALGVSSSRSWSVGQLQHASITASLGPSKAAKYAAMASGALWSMRACFSRRTCASSVQVRRITFVVVDTSVVHGTANHSAFRLSKRLPSSTAAHVTCPVFFGPEEFAMDFSAVC